MRIRTSAMRSFVCAFASLSARDIESPPLSPGEETAFLLGRRHGRGMDRSIVVLADELRRQLLDARGHLRRRLVNDDWAALVERRRNEPTRRNHRVDLDAHHPLHVTGVEADLGV